ncbi:saframycin Mx1 synthetase B [Legionella busanensis]|uniref:Saframycin Mx1 synthetase B n=1 Tax=Legionella busanensis TaxID=190655 RepID=A0A378JKL6_9GAMM|nr:fatty acyl-AMP ligase [Legionella busanensis]STX51775.1 saframycin Mx1 synthetase B [Legionella busanensis]
MRKKLDFNNVIDLFNDRWQISPHHPLYFYSTTGHTKDSICYSYDGMRHKILSIAALIQANTQPGDRVLMIFAPGIDYITTFWACLFAGVLAVPAYPPFDKNTVEKLQAIINNATPKLILSNQEIISNIKKLSLFKTFATNKLLKNLAYKFSNKTSELCEWDFEKFRWLDIGKANKNWAEKYKPITIKPNDVAYLQYTSGSTAMPKGVMVTHRNILANLSLVLQTIGEQENDRMVSWLPPYHDMGLIGNLLFPVYAQIPILMMSPITFLRHPYLWLNAISDFKATVSGGPNFAFELCERKIDPKQLAPNFSLASWRVAYNGAEPINYHTLENFYLKFKEYCFKKQAYYPLYGLAEATVFVSGKDKDDHLTYLPVKKSSLQQHNIVLNDKQVNSTVLVSCGKPKVPTIIISETLQPCAEGEIGEIWLQGDSVTLGYWQKEQDTKEAYQATLPGDDSNQTYLRTGDLGFLYYGNLYITGRIKDLIIINGKNHYPHDIELVVHATHPLIRLGCTAAFSLVSDGQEKLAIVAELKEPANLNVYLIIIQKIRAIVNLHHSLDPFSIALLPPKTLPKTTSGKLRRNYTKQLLENNQLELLYNWCLEAEVVQ